MVLKHTGCVAQKVQLPRTVALQLSAPLLYTTLHFCFQLPVLCVCHQLALHLLGVSRETYCISPCHYIASPAPILLQCLYTATHSKWVSCDPRLNYIDISEEQEAPEVECAGTQVSGYALASANQCPNYGSHIAHDPCCLLVKRLWEQASMQRTHLGCLLKETTRSHWTATACFKLAGPESIRCGTATAFLLH